jgi:hypothetical protein
VGADAEKERLEADAKRTANWKRWGPYLSERQWATVREDYSADGGCWNCFPHSVHWFSSSTASGWAPDCELMQGKVTTEARRHRARPKNPEPQDSMTEKEIIRTSKFFSLISAEIVLKRHPYSS